MSKEPNVTFENVKKLVVRKVGLNYQLTEIGMKFFVELVIERINEELNKRGENGEKD